MFKYLISIILCLALIGTAQGGWWEIGETAAPSGGGSYADITYYHNCDTLSGTPTIGSGTTVFNVGISLNTTTPITNIGSITNSGANYSNIEIPASNINFEDSVLGFYFRPSADNTGLDYLVRTDNGSYNYTLRWNDTRVIYLTWDGVHSTTSASLVVGTEYFVEVIFNGLTATFKIDGVTIGSVTASTPIPANTIMWVSGYNESSSVAGDFDQIIISNDTSRDLNAIKDNTDISN